MNEKMEKETGKEMEWREKKEEKDIEGKENARDTDSPEEEENEGREVEDFSFGHIP